MVAALLVFRVIYYWLPLLIATAMLGWNEWKLKSEPTPRDTLKENKRTSGLGTAIGQATKSYKNQRLT